MEKYNIKDLLFEDLIQMEVEGVCKEGLCGGSHQKRKAISDSPSDRGYEGGDSPSY